MWVLGQVSIGSGLVRTPPLFCSSSVKQSEKLGLLSGSFVDSCDMTRLRRDVTGVPLNSGGVAWHRTPG